MNAQAYCRFARPVVTGLIVIVYSTIGWIEIRTFMRLPAAENWFLTLAVVVPLLCGSLLTGAIHELMHQSFFGVLPGARRSLRRWHGGMLAIVTTALAATSSKLVPDMSVASTIGISAAVLALPLLNRRASPSPSRFLWIAACLLLGCGLFYLVGAQIYSIATAAPWVVLPAGLSIAGACFRIGFDRNRVRARAGRPFRSMLNSLRYLFSKDGRTLQATVLAEAQRRNKRIGRDWLVKSVDSSDRAWLQVLLHERYGIARHSTVWTGIVLLMLIGTAMPLGFILLFGSLSGSAGNLSSLCEAIATSGRSGLQSGFSPSKFISFISFFIPILMGFLGAIVPAPMSRIAYPLPRHRIARLSFILSARQAGLGVALQVFGVFGIVFFSSLLAGIPIRMENASGPMAVIFLQLPVIPLMQSTVLVKPRLLAVSGFSLLFILFFASIGFAARFAFELSWPAVAGSLIATAFAAWLNWRVVLWRYSTSDLNQPMGLIAVPATS